MLAFAVLASCGGDDSADQARAPATVAGASGPTGADDARAAKPDGSGGSGERSDTGGAARAEPQSSSGKGGDGNPDGERTDGGRKQSGKPGPKGGATPDIPSLEELKKEADRINKRQGNPDSPGSEPAPPAPQHSAGPEQVLKRKSKRVCDEIGLEALARRYDVKATPEAVATAYAASYPATLRKAVHDGCKSAF